jgi:hypothetical protein
LEEGIRFLLLKNLETLSDLGITETLILLFMMNKIIQMLRQEHGGC